MSKHKKIKQFYVVACTELHYCIGPITSAKTAALMARFMTEMDQSDCVYLPVPLVFQGEVIPMDEVDMVPKRSKKDEKDYMGGQYL